MIVLEHRRFIRLPENYIQGLQELDFSHRACQAAQELDKPLIVLHCRRA